MGSLMDILLPIQLLDAQFTSLQDKNFLQLNVGINEGIKYSNHLG